MRVELKDDNLVLDVEEMLTRMKDVCEKEKKLLLKRFGDIIKKNLIKHMKRSKIHKNDYVHMIDDVKSTIKTSKAGNVYVSVSGGKKTAYKWIFLNDGAIDNKGNVLNQANHFMEKGIEDSNSEIDKELNIFLEKLVK